MTERRRITYFDWLRGLATIAVVLLHEFNMVLSTHEIAELGTTLVTVWTWLQLLLVRWAVPCFLMISGALLLDPSRQLDWRRLARYLLRMAGALALFCPIYACVSARGITFAAILKGWRKALVQDSWDHLWYVYALMGLYLLTPILRSYVASTGKREQRTNLLVLAVVTLLLPTVNAAAATSIPTLVWVGSSFFYYLLGSYAQRFVDWHGRLAILGVGCLALALGLSTWLVIGWQWYPLWLLKPACPLTAGWSLLVFLTAKRWLEARRLPPGIAWLSRHSMGIYLAHPIAFVVLYRRLWWLPYHPLPPVAFECAAFAIALGCSVAVTAALAQIPVIRKLV